MGSRHKALLITTGGGQKLHKAERDEHVKDLNNFLSSQGVNDWDRGSAIAHFDMGYDDGYSGQAPYFGEDWDGPMSHEARSLG